MANAQFLQCNTSGRKQMSKCLYDIFDNHREWFKKRLIDSGAADTITNAQIEASCGFKDSKRSYLAGYVKADEDITEEMKYK